ncbi:MAG: sigma-70 family RNA polymerase sigma factor [Moraxella sp.]|uniref:sigma-70 family RNA polymerase sigma factor n=1 Tax=Moraxella sp. TaxID=479 RepID=UPI0026DB2BDD|nr:sigma-70 family RNA polymerase sigma factor [Moraxella sp.]MDO4450612.1 sigma-70 family RNA polymerase sigma factor [Moraxella sp.]
MTNNLHHFDKDGMEEIYESMFSFAYNQLDNEQHAKDVVQDALVNALKYADSFQGKSTFKTWVFAILKNKIADFIRQNKRYTHLSQINDEYDDEMFLATLFDEIGHWQQGVSPNAFDDSWQNPHHNAENNEFWQVLEICLENLPKEQARAFLMKEYIELGSDEICQNLNITRQNLYVLLYRARLRLQMCLSAKWFV